MFLLAHAISNSAINIAADNHISNSIVLSGEKRKRYAIFRSFCDRGISSCNYVFFFLYKYIWF